MEEPFITFQRFADIELANLFTEKLDQSAIPYRILKEPQILDAGIIGTSYLPDYALKLQAKDFSKAHEFLGEHFKALADNVEPDYYLFEFSNQELFNILTRPDEWGYFDYQLAKKILVSRNAGIDDPTLQRLKESRMSELAKPEKSAAFLLLVGYALIVAGAFASRDLLNGGSNPFPLSLIFCIFIGHHLSKTKKILPDGQTLYTYSKNNREHGSAILTIATILLTFSIGVWFYQLYLFYQP